MNNEDEEDNFVPLDQSNKKKKKPVTKAAIAKRILKKNIIPNKKIVFTEEGEASINYNINKILILQSNPISMGDIFQEQMKITKSADSSEPHYNLSSAAANDFSKDS